MVLSVRYLCSVCSTSPRTAMCRETCAYSAAVRDVLIYLASCWIQGTVHSYIEQSRIQHNENTRRVLQPDIGSIFHIKKSMKYSDHRKLLCESSKLSNLVLFTSSDTKRTLMHLFLFTNSAKICMQSIHDSN